MGSGAIKAVRCSGPGTVALTTVARPAGDAERAFAVARDRVGGQAIKVQLRP